MRSTGTRRLPAKRLLIQHDTHVLGSALDRAYPVDGSDCFVEALEAIDQAECQVRPDCGTGTAIID